MGRIKRVMRALRQFSVKLRDNHVDVYSASAAYYMFICAVPLVLVLFSIMPFTPLTEENVINVVNVIFPGEISGHMTALITEVYSSQFTILSVSAVIAIWSASRALMSIRRGLDEIFHIMEPYNYVIIRLKSMVYTLLTIIIMSVEMMFGAFGQQVLDLIAEYFPEASFVEGFGFFYTNLAFTIGAFIIIMSFYCLLPRKKQNVKTQFLGAVISTLGCVGFSFLFSLFLNFVKDGFSMYGSLATIVILLVWLYVIMFLVFLGAQINSEIYDFKYLIRRIRNERDDKEA